MRRRRRKHDTHNLVREQPRPWPPKPARPETVADLYGRAIPRHAGFWEVVEDENETASLVQKASLQERDPEKVMRALVIEPADIAAAAALRIWPGTPPTLTSIWEHLNGACLQMRYPSFEQRINGQAGRTRATLDQKLKAIRVAPLHRIEEILSAKSEKERKTLRNRLFREYGR